MEKPNPIIANNNERKKNQAITVITLIKSKEKTGEICANHINQVSYTNQWAKSADSPDGGKKKTLKLN